MFAVEVLLKHGADPNLAMHTGMTAAIYAAGEGHVNILRLLLKHGAKTDASLHLPPTPSKFHYIFTMNDLGKIVEGCCLATPDKFTKDSQVIRLWRNECTRIFTDRLTHSDDIKQKERYTYQRK